MHAAFKRLAEVALLHGGPAFFSRRRIGPGPLILAYHNILPEHAEPGQDTSLHLGRAVFARQLDILAESCEVVPLDMVLQAPNGDGRPRVIITFDDAYHGALSAGAAELARRKLPATFFVAPGFLGGRSFWWDVLAGPGGKGLPDGLRARALDEYQGRDERVRQWMASEGWEAREPEADCRCASEEAVRASLAHPGLTLASHTWSHPNLNRLEDAELKEELERPLRWLRERFQRVLPWLSYPYGLSNSRVEAMAREAGYSGALLVSGGWSQDPSRNPFAIPRFNVPAGLSLDGFRLRLAGLLCH
jgi:peptidoglycan/xylan/chitin deacetylase (PgdA/CDA1 family)